MKLKEFRIRIDYQLQVGIDTETDYLVMAKDQKQAA